MVSDWTSVGGGGDVVCANASEYIVYVSMSVCEKHPHMYILCMSVCMYLCVSMRVYACA